MLDRWFRRAPAPPPRSYSDGWRDAQAHILAYLEGYAVALRTTANAQREPLLAAHAAAVDRVAEHVRKMKEGEP